MTITGKSGTYELSFDNIDLGSVEVGETISDYVRVENTGTFDLNLVSISDDMPSFVATADWDLLEPGASGSITVEFTPEDEKQYLDMAILSFTGNYSVSIGLSGNGFSSSVLASKIGASITPNYGQSKFRINTGDWANISSVRIVNLEGETVWNMENAGREIIWDGRNNLGIPCSKGKYFVILDNNSENSIMWLIIE